MCLQAYEISKLGRPKTQYETLRRGIEKIILLEVDKERTNKEKEKKM